MATGHNLIACHQCPHRVRGQQGKAPCDADEEKRDIIELAERHLCPLGKFTLSGPGDVVARIAYITGAKRAWMWIRFKLRIKRPCRCSERQSRWNEWWKRMWG